MEKIICYTDGGARGNPGPAGAGAVIAKVTRKELPVFAVTEKAVTQLAERATEYGSVKVPVMVIEAALAPTAWVPFAWEAI